MEVTQFNGNINKDITNNLRKFEDPSFVLNAIRDDSLGNKPSYQSEPGNASVFNIPGKVLIGQIYGEDSEVYLFHTDGQGNDLIGVSKEGNYTILVDTNFGFDPNYPIIGSYKVVNGCEKTIYWCDAVRPDRYFNLDRVDDFKKNGEWVPNSFSLRPNIIPPTIEAIGIASFGGNLLAGKYFIQLEILDSRSTTIFRTNVSNGVSIYYDDINEAYNDIDGNYNIESYTPAEGGKPITTKAIIYNFSGLDPIYKYVRVNVILATTGNGTTLTAFSKADLIPITGDTISFTLSNISNMDIIEDVAKLLVPTAKYYSSEYMKIVNNRLLRGGVTEIARDYSSLQRSASKVGVKYNILEVPAFDTNKLGNAKNPLTPYSTMSLMGDEVVALGIIYLYDDGTESPSMHIPGVCKDLNGIPTGEDYICKIMRFSFTVPTEGPVGYTYNYNIEILIDGVVQDIPIFVNVEGESPVIVDVPVRYINTFNFIRVYDPLYPNNSVQDYTYELLEGVCEEEEEDPPKIHSEIFDKAEDINAEHVFKYELNPDGSYKLDSNGELIPRTLLEKWEIYNTAYKLGPLNGYNGYHEISNKLYPDIKDCNGEDIWGEDICGNPLLNTPIRHHRIVDRRTEPHYKSLGVVEEKDRYLIEVTVNTDIEPPPSGSPITLDITYIVSGNSFTESKTYFELGKPTVLVILDDEPDSVSVTITDPGSGNGELTVFYEVKSSVVTIDNTNNSVIRLIGLEFYNVEYPDPNIVGHYFVVADYDNTIISKGYNSSMLKMAYPSPITEYTEYAYGYTSLKENSLFNNLNSDRYSFLSPEFFYNKQYISGEYFKNEYVYTPTITKRSYNVIDQGTVFSKKADIALVARDRIPVPVYIPVRHNYPIDQCAVIAHQSQHAIDTEQVLLTNYTLNNRVFTYRGVSVKPSNDFTYGAIKTTREYYTDIFSIKYRKLHTNHFNLSKTRYQVYGGDVYISKMPYINVLFSGFDKNLFADILLFIVTGGFFLGSVVRSFLNGDSDAFERYETQYLSGDISTYRLIRDAFNESLNKSFGFLSDSLDNLFYETKINTSLANESSDLENRFLYRGGRSLSYLFQAVTERTENAEGDVYYSPKKTGIGEYFYSYNKDYSKINDFQSSYPLSPIFDYCSTCIGEYPNRVIWSPASLDEDVFDTFRIALATDYKDFPPHKGKIKGLSYRGGKVLVHTTQTTYLVPVNQQEIKTSAENVYISSGNFMSLDPMELLESNIGFAGLQDKLALLSTPFGEVWLDNYKSTLVMFSGELKNLSGQGLGQWYWENIRRSEYITYFKDKGIDINYSISGKAGHQLVYDPRFKRIILAKKDYKIIPQNLGLEGPEVLNGLRITLLGDLERYNGSTWVKVSPNNSTYFENKSLTLSYSLEYQGWTSWHSYLPDFMFSDEFYYYTNKEGNTFRHLHINNFQRYYNIKYPFIIETYKSGVNTELLDSIIYVGYAQEWDSNRKQWKDVSQDITFDGIMAYNSDCNTGLLKVKLLNQDNDFYSNIAYVPDEVTCIRTDNNYKINGLYDYSSSVPVISSSWNDIRASFAVNGYTDIVPYNINLDKPHYELPPIRGKYVAVRLLFKPVGDIRKVIHLMTPMQTVSIR